jgi:hypothetical protein
MAGYIVPGTDATHGGKVHVQVNAEVYNRLVACHVGGTVTVFYDDATLKVSNITCS